MAYYATDSDFIVRRCEDYTALSFQELAERFFDNRRANPFRRFLAIMRKAGVRYMTEERLDLDGNKDFDAEKAEIENVLRTAQSLDESSDVDVEIKADRLTFFGWLPPEYLNELKGARNALGNNDNQDKRWKNKRWAKYTSAPPPLAEKEQCDQLIGYAVIATVSFPLRNPGKILHYFSRFIHEQYTFDKLAPINKNPADHQAVMDAAKGLDLPFSVDEEQRDGKLWGKASYVFEAGIERPRRDAANIFTSQDLPKKANDVPTRIPVQDRFIHAFTRLTTTVGSRKNHKEYTFGASVFHEQSAISSSCGHMAILTALNSSAMFTRAGGKCIGHAELYDAVRRAKEELSKSRPEALNARAPLMDHLVFVTVLKEFAEKWNFTLKTLYFKMLEPGTHKFKEYIYPAMESGYPVILNFTENARGNDVESHSVAIIGHTQDSDSWLNLDKADDERTRVISVTEWQTGLILSDDVYGPHLNISPEKLIDHTCSFRERVFNLDTAHCLLPKGVYADIGGVFQEKVFERNKIVENIVKDCLLFLDQTNKTGEYDCKRYVKWLERLNRGPILIRPLLVTKHNYWNHLAVLAKTKEEDPEYETHIGKSGERRDGDDIHAEEEMEKVWPAWMVKAFRDLPDHVMVVEVSLPYIYDGNKHKLMDLIFASRSEESSDQEYDMQNILFWGAGVVGRVAGGTIGDPERCLLPPHVPYIRTNILHEW